jgi:hypothetical protein
VNHHRAAVSSFCGWLVKQGVIRENPCVGAYRSTEVIGDPVYLTRTQWPVVREAIARYTEHRVARWEAEPNEDHTRAYPDGLYFDFLVATGATSYNEGCTVVGYQDRREPRLPHRSRLASGNEDACARA